MADFKVFVTRTFEEKLCKEEKDFRDWVEKVFDQLNKNPFAGKPLGTKWFREKKFKNKRVYFLVFEDKESVYLVDISGKKDQQKIINSILFLLDSYKKEIEELVPK